LATPGVSVLLSDPGSAALLAATDRGVFRTTDKGASWTSLNVGLDDLDMSSLARAPSDSATLYAGAGSRGLYRTANGGLTWTRTALDSQWYAVPLAVDPRSEMTVYVAQYDGLIKSSDGGEMWTQSRMFDAGISSLVFAGATLYVGTWGGEIWTTDDGGGNWQLLHAFGGPQGISAIQVDPGSPSVLYASWIESGPAPGGYIPHGGVFKSTDAGLNWQSVENGLGVTTLVMNLENPSVLYAAVVRGQVLRSTNAGASWLSVGEGLPEGWISALLFSPTAPSTLYAGVSGPFVSGVVAVRVDDRELHDVSGPKPPTRVVTRD
jgi:photosystem II stability/assembly factor-like uncharacterized protein